MSGHDFDPQADKVRPWQYSLRTLFLLISVVAFLLAIGVDLPLIVVWTTLVSIWWVVHVQAMHGGTAWQQGQGPSKADLSSFLGRRDRSLAEDWRFWESLINAGNSKASQERYAEAIEIFTDSIELLPQQAAGYRNRGECYFHLGKMDDAVLDCTEAILLEPGDAEAYFFRGRALLGLGRTVQAIADFDMAAKLDPLWKEAREQQTEANAALETKCSPGTA